MRLPGSNPARRYGFAPALRYGPHKSAALSSVSTAWDHTRQARILHPCGFSRRRLPMPRGTRRASPHPPSRRLDPRLRPLKSACCFGPLPQSGANAGPGPQWNGCTPCPRCPKRVEHNTNNWPFQDQKQKKANKFSYHGRALQNAGCRRIVAELLPGGNPLKEGAMAFYLESTNKIVAGNAEVMT